MIRKKTHRRLAILPIFALSLFVQLFCTIPLIAQGVIPGLFGSGSTSGAASGITLKELVNGYSSDQWSNKPFSLFCKSDDFSQNCFYSPVQQAITTLFGVLYNQNPPNNPFNYVTNLTASAQLDTVNTSSKSPPPIPSLSPMPAISGTVNGTLPAPTGGSSTTPSSGDFLTSVGASRSAPSGSSPAAGSTMSYADVGIYNLLMATSDNYGKQLTNMLQVPVPIPAASGDIAVFYTTTTTQTTGPLNLDSLLLPVQYTAQQAEDAQNFIQFNSGLAQPLPVIDFSKFSSAQVKTEQQSGLVQQYLLALQSMVANQSVGFSNLYYLYAQRIPRAISQDQLTAIKGLGFNSLPQSLQNNASELALDEFMATRRFDPAWQAYIEGRDPPNCGQDCKAPKASPAELQRETIYLLREMRYEMYRSRLQNERLLAALSTLEMQATGNAQLGIKQAQNNICSQQQYKDANACYIPPSVSSTPPPVTTTNPTQSLSNTPAATPGTTGATGGAGAAIPQAPATQ